MRYWIVLLVLFNWVVNGVLGQNQSNLIFNGQSPYTYIFKITNEQADVIYKKSIWKIDTTFFNTLIDSFATHATYDKKLSPGHYLKTYIKENKLKIEVASVTDFDIFILNNQTDFCVQVIDLQGNIVNQAEVKIDHKNVRFDKKTQTYLIKKSNKEGILKVSHNGVTGYYDIDKKWNNPGFKRGFRKVVYRTPLKYVWRPIRYIFMLPVDAVRSIIHRYPVGTINRTVSFFNRLWINFSCIFSDYQCSQKSNFYNDAYNYLVFSKPKYHIADTVKFKAYIHTDKQKPLNKPLDVYIGEYNDIKPITCLNPYRPGGYVYSFFLHDSLGLKLDKNYSIVLKDDKGKEYMRQSFRYEAYDIYKYNLSVKLPSVNQYSKIPFEVDIKATDENELNLHNAHIKIKAIKKSISECIDTLVFIPNVLFEINEKLNPSGNTKIILPDLEMPHANFSYKLVTTLTTSDNRVITQEKTVQYYYQHDEIEMTIDSDSLLIRYKNKGITEEVLGEVFSRDQFGNDNKVYEGKLPVKIKINPYFKYYVSKAKSVEKVKYMKPEPSMLSCYATRTHREIVITADNPYKIPFSYNIYKANNEKVAGFGDTLYYRENTSSHKSYFISLRYIWAGEVVEENYSIPLQKSALKIEVKQPQLVFPDQKTEVEVTVKDYKNKPVKNADITALAPTGKFDYTAPNLREFRAKKTKEKHLINNFNLTNNHQTKVDQTLDFSFWSEKTKIDTLSYYQLVYPKNGFHRLEYFTKDSITQFAPFVASRGELLPIHVIYVDHLPVYFSWSSYQNPYSFEVSPGYHHIKLRTTHASITLDSVYFNANKKLIFSVDKQAKLPHVKTTVESSTLTEHEQNFLHKYTLPIKTNMSFKNTYLISEQGVYSLTNTNYFGYKVKAFHCIGPLHGSLKLATINYAHYSENEVSFDVNSPKYNVLKTFDMEPFYQYEINTDLIKLNQYNLIAYPKDLSLYEPKIKFYDEVSTIDKLNNTILNSSVPKIPRYINPTNTPAYQASLSITYIKNKELEKHPQYVLIFNRERRHEFRVNHATISTINALSPGIYDLVYLYKDSTYFAVDSIVVKSEGENFLKVFEPLNSKKDGYSAYFTGLVSARLSYHDETEKLENEKYKTFSNYTGSGITIKGKVTDQKGEPLAFVMIRVSGSNYGTMTDFDGHYSLTIPHQYSMLEYRYIGYQAELVEGIYNNQTINITLQDNIQILNEVQLLYSAQSVSVSRSDIMKIPGVSIASMSSVVSIANSPNISSQQIKSSEKPSFDPRSLIIIDGQLFSGDPSTITWNTYKSIRILSAIEAQKSFGDAALYGAVVLESYANTIKGANYDDNFYDEAKSSSGIRSRFSDYAFWQPELFTDKHGKARFEVHFPDDVTSWDAHYFVMSGKKQSGQAYQQTKSYKPVMAQLSVPTFLVRGDTAAIIGKTSNYSPNEILINTSIEVQGQKRQIAQRNCLHSILDPISVTASTNDTLSVLYSVSLEDGYLDGERRKIPVYNEGLEKTFGQFCAMYKDTSFTWNFLPEYGPITLYAHTDMLQIIRGEINHVINYKHACNEQLASKLKVLITDKIIAEFTDTKFRHEKLVEKIINKLVENKRSYGLWGWWKTTEESWWISMHVLEALLMAEKNGFSVPIEKNKMIEYLVSKLSFTQPQSNSLHTLKILQLLESKVDYQKFLLVFDEKINELPFSDYLSLISIKQKAKLPYSLDRLWKSQKQTMLGNVYFSEGKNQYYPTYSYIQYTLQAYQILKNDAVDHQNILQKMRSYILEARGSGYWQNTFESAQIIETILPDLLNENKNLILPELQLTGAVNQRINTFPSEIKINSGSSLNISKTGTNPIYFTAYQHYWESQPKAEGNGFEISLSFENDNQKRLTAGKEVKLKAIVKVHHDAQFVMVNIPIPAGCSYLKKDRKNSYESHREYFPNETAIYCERIHQGIHEFEIMLMPRFSGSYTLNPAHVEMMYYPTFSANNSMSRICIEAKP